MFLLSPEYWQVKKTKLKGKGVFAKKNIPAGTVIGDYLGTFIRVEEEDVYEKKHGFYTMYYHKNASIFPDLTKDGIHLLNHSCSPNCYIYSYKGRTLYFSLRRIFKGEELTISYLLNPQDEECSPCTHFCQCGSNMCTSSMHLSHKKYNTWVAFDDKKTKNMKMPRVTYGEKLKKLASYPKNIPDNAVYSLFGSDMYAPLSVFDNKIPSKKEIRQKMRETGQRLFFKKQGIMVIGIDDQDIICKTTASVK